jgi:branched-subunit amino acid aminotransferase/4-amino-4-deoxychorismate lyase
MNNLISYDGVIMDESSLRYGASNRSFRYGDGVFETMRYEEGELFFIDDHFERLISGMYALGLDTTMLNPLQICEDIQTLCANKSCSSARIRLSVYRKEGGAYCPDTDQFHIIITAEEIADGGYTFNQKGLRIGLYSEIRKPVNTLSGVKSANALIYVLASRHARDNSWDDALLLNENGRICEACSSNVFIVLPDKRILTPPVTEGILPGVMRKNLISWLNDNGKVVEEVILLPDDFYRAEEVFLTNVISGVRWVLAFREKRFFSTYTKKLLEEFIASEVF